MEVKLLTCTGHPQLMPWRPHPREPTAGPPPVRAAIQKGPQWKLSAPTMLAHLWAEQPNHGLTEGPQSPSLYGLAVGGLSFRSDSPTAHCNQP